MYIHVYGVDDEYYKVVHVCMNIHMCMYMYMYMYMIGLTYIPLASVAMKINVTVSEKTHHLAQISDIEILVPRCS